MKPVDSSIKNNEKNISCSVGKNEYKLLNITSLHCIYRFMNIVTLGYSVFHMYLEEAGYYFIDLGFIYIYNASYIYKIYASRPLLVNWMHWFHIYDSTVDSFAFAFWKVLISATPESTLVDLVNKQHHYQ